MDIKNYAYTDRDKAIWFVNQNTIKYQLEIDGIIKVIQLDISNAKNGITYIASSIENAINLDAVTIGKDIYDLDIHRQDNSVDYQLKQDIDATIPDDPNDPAYPVFVYGSGTDEPATETIIFPPPETVEQFMERVWAKLLHLTRRIKILRHEEPHQNALSEKICREVPEDHDEVLRYDIACNLIKRPCGWLALQLQTYQERYNRHLAAVVKAKEAGTTPPTFNRGSDETKIETMLDKLEANLTEECLQNHFDLHDHGEWDKIQNKQRKITLCDDDSSPGEVLVDVNSFFTDGDGNIAETHAKKTYHDISTKYWVMAKRTPHRNLVTQRTVEID